MNNIDLTKYEELLCPNCEHNFECNHDKFVMNKFNTTKNIKCFSYEWKNKKD